MTAQAPEDKAAAEAEKEAEKAAKAEASRIAALTEVTVTWKGNSRTYSRKVHGKAFYDHAVEFAAKSGGEIV